MTAVEINGLPCVRARVQIPAWGAWWADVDPVGAQVLSGGVTLVVGGVTLKGTVISGGASEGRSGYRIVGGAGGWGRTVPARGYADDAGVTLATVVRDVASVVG